MSIGPVSLAGGPVAAPVSVATKGFAQELSAALSKLNTMEVGGQQAMVNLAAGRGSVEAAVVATQEASLAGDLASSMAGRVLQVYQSLWSLQT